MEGQIDATLIYWWGDMNVSEDVGAAIRLPPNSVNIPEHIGDLP